MTAFNNEYTQMDKNTVDAKDQFRGTPNTDFYNPYGKGVRVLFVGNSITLHGVAEHIGWSLRCGMAASCPENDYVHILMNKINSVSPDAAFCVCNVSSWEVNYKGDDSKLGVCDLPKTFDADIIVMRFIENVPKKDFDDDLFKAELEKFFAYLNPDNKANLILSTGFWKHPGDRLIREYAEANSLPLVELNDLGELDEMKAIGLFEHSGVANHPDDLGMKSIAERFFSEIKKHL